MWKREEATVKNGFLSCCLVAAVSVGASAADRVFDVRPCFRNLEPGARTLIADWARKGAEWKAPSGRTKVFVRGQFFYGLERSDYIHNWYERPLFQDTSYAAANERGHSINERSWRKTVSVAKEMGLDGLAFFLENPGCRDVLSRSVLPGAEITVLGEFASERECPRGIDYCADVADALLASPNAFRLGGKTVISSYPFTTWENRTIDFWPKLRAELVRRHGEDKFVFLPYLLVFDGADLDRPSMSAATLEKTREHLREVLRKTDGLFYMLHETDWAPADCLRRAHDEIVIPLVKSVLSEPEFKGKYLGIGFWQGHENVYRHMGIYPSYGLTRLVTALDSIAKVGPDIALGFEWDEENENTHFRPTVSNGQTAQRVMRYYADRFSGRAPHPYPGDDPSLPNLILSYRKSAQAGELLEAQVCNVPDGTGPASGWEISFRWKTPEGRVVRDYPARRLSSADCALVSFDAPVSSLVDHRLLVPELTVAKKGARPRVFAKGFWPVNLEPNANPDVKWVRQALREIVPDVSGGMSVGEADVEGFRTVRAQVKSPVPLRSVEVLDGVDTVYLHDAAKPAGRDLSRRTVRVAFLAMPCFWKQHVAKGTVEIAGAPGAVLSELLPHYVRRKGFVWTLDNPTPRFNFKSVLYADIPAEEFERTEVVIDLPDVLPSRHVRVADVFRENGVSFGLPAGGQVVVTPCTQVGMPPPCDVKEAAFSFPLKVRNPSGVLRLQAIDVNGRLWRGPAVALGKDTGRRQTFHVYERASGTVTRVEADESRMMALDFTFPENFTGAVRSGDRLDMPAVFGGGEGILNERGCGINGILVYGHAMAYGNPPLDRAEAKFITLPRQSLPPYSGFDLRIRLRPDGLKGKEGIYDTGNLGLRIWLEDGVPHAFLSLGNEMLARGKNDTAGVAVTGPALKDGEWNELRLRFDQQTARIEVNGKPGQAKTCCGFEYGAQTPALGVLFDGWRFFRGTFGGFSVRSL